MKSDGYLTVDNKAHFVKTDVLNRNRFRHVVNGRTKSFQHHRHQLQLLCSFLCGFLMAYTTVIFYDRYLVLSVKIEEHSTNAEYYETGYMMALKNLELEEFSLHDDLTKSVRVLCMVLTCPKYHQERAIHVKKTWGSRCTKLIFMSSEVDEDLDAVAVIERDGDVYTKLWNKTRESFRYAYENHIDDYDWFLKADDDTYVIMENLRYMLYAYEPYIPLCFGYRLNQTVPYMSGGASYVLSKDALKQFMEVSYHNESLCAPADVELPEDVNMSRCLTNASVLMVNSKYATEGDEKTKFFPLQLTDYTNPVWNNTLPDWLFEMSEEPVETGLNCCSNYSVAFHYADPATMYAMEFLIYYLQAFGLRHPVGKLPSKVSSQKIFNEFSKNNTD